MPFPQNLDTVPAINPDHTLAVAEHTNLHSSTFDSLYRTQAYIGAPIVGEKAGTLRQRVHDLEKGGGGGGLTGPLTVGKAAGR